MSDEMIKRDDPDQEKPLTRPLAFISRSGDSESVLHLPADDHNDQTKDGVVVNSFFNITERHQRFPTCLTSEFFISTCQMQLL